jgi:hypothetical protein
VVKADPEWVRDNTHAPEYRFSRRIFYANPSERGVYHDPVSGQEADDHETANLE